MLLASFIFLVVSSLISLAQAADQATASWLSRERDHNMSWTGEKEGGQVEMVLRGGDQYPINLSQYQERRRGRVFSLRDSRSYRRTAASQRLLNPSKHPYRKTPQQFKTSTPSPRYKSKGREPYKKKTRIPPWEQTQPRTSSEQITKKYSGVKFPKLNLFPKLKLDVSSTKVNKLSQDGKYTLPDRLRPGINDNKKSLTVNSTLPDSRKLSKYRHRGSSRRFKVNTTTQYKKQPAQSGATTIIQPSPSQSKYDPDDAINLVPSKEDNSSHVDLMSGISPDLDGLITVTHRVFTRTRQEYEETLTSLSEVVDVNNLRSTMINSREIMFAYSEYNHPSRGITELTFEEIRPTQTYMPHSRKWLPAYNILTHTTRLTNTVQSTKLPDQEEVQVERVLSNIIPNLLIPTNPLSASTSYTTLTITKVATITSDVTSDIIITLGGRPVKTEYVVPTTMVFTDLHISRSAMVVWQ